MAADSLAHSGSDSATLVGRLKAREPHAWERFTHIYGPLVYRWARRAGLQDSDAADVMQEVLQAVSQGILRFRREESGDTFRGWLWGITRLKILQVFRHRKLEPQLAADPSLAGLAELPESPSNDLSDDLAIVARRALALLQSDFQPVTWQAFEQTVMHGRAAADVAAELGIAIGSVYTAKCRVTARLRQELGDLL
jgi:RNA polymerase sigma-70 factor (ECF subfamily)